MAKATANYANSALIKMEAIIDGYAEGIALDESGLSARAAARTCSSCGTTSIYTPPLTSSILSGITRDTCMTLARDLGFEVREQPLPREFLYLADEVFFCGTAVEITPDSLGRQDHRRARGGAGRSPRRCSSASSRSSTAELPDAHGWLTYRLPRRRSIGRRR